MKGQIVIGFRCDVITNDVMIFLLLKSQSMMAPVQLSM